MAAALGASRRLGLVLGFGFGSIGCVVVPPPPIATLHASTAADPRGTTTAMIVVGLAGQLFGGDGIGLALRVEHQETDRTTLGIELAGGSGVATADSPADKIHLKLIAIRGYGKFTPRTTDVVAVTYGVGLSALTTGMIAAQAHGGGAISYPNAYFEPYLHTGLAASVPVRAGRSFGDLIDARHGASRVRSDLFFYVDGGFVVPVGDTGNAASVALGLIDGLFHDGGFMTISAADAQR